MSSIPEITSTPVTATAIPAPMPTLPALSFLDASAIVWKRSAEDAVTFNFASSFRVTTASFRIRAVVLADTT